MSRLFISAIAAFFSLSFAAAPAAAQDGTDTINQLIVYGEDACPVSTADQITVCARKDEAERYRIPEILRESESPQNEAWNNRVLAYETVMASGSLSCSPSGGGGWHGCTQKMIEQAYAEKETDASLRFSELIAEERAKRLSTIDEEAEIQQEEVEAAEAEYFEKQAASKSADKGEGQ